MSADPPATGPRPTDAPAGDPPTPHRRTRRPATRQPGAPFDSGVGWPGMLPGRPLSGGPQPRPAKRAVCCSGGGIQATAFSLGGLQRLGRRGSREASPTNRHRSNGGPHRTPKSWFDGVSLITGVSGGAHIAGSFAMVHHAGKDTTEFSDVPVYAPGSPEDNRLRAHTRYLIEGPHAVSTGVLAIAYGLVLNLLPILAVLYISAKIVGWLILAPSGLLQVASTPTGQRWQLGDLVWWSVGIGALAALGLIFFAAERFIDVYARPKAGRTAFLERACLDCLGLAVLAAVLLLGVPGLLTGIGAIDTSAVVQHVPAYGQVVSFTGTVAALVALVKTALGRFRGSLQTSASKPGPVTGFITKHIRALAPWLGSLIGVALLLLAFLVWVNNAVALGPTTAQIAACLAVLAGCMLWRLCTDINRTSIHPFYKARLCSAFAVMRAPDGSRAVEQPYDVPMRLSDYRHDTAFPTVVVCASVQSGQDGVVPAGRSCVPFTFSPYWTGISAGSMFSAPPDEVTGNTNEPGDPGTRDFPTEADAAEGVRLMLPTDMYERRAGIRSMTLPGAMAVSGAGVLPQLRGPGQAPMRFLLALANVRLGLWLPNPLDRQTAHHVDAPVIRPWPRVRRDEAERDLWPLRRAWLRSVLALLSWQWHQPGIRALVAEMTGRTRLDGRWIYVSDGGEYDNLGLVEALRRGATEIVVLDATADETGASDAFRDTVELARADLGVEIELDSAKAMAPVAAGDAPVQAVKGTFRYPNGVPGSLYLCRPAKGADGYSGLEGDREFEAYRWFGEVAADLALQLMRAPAEKQPRPKQPATAAPPARDSVENAGPVTAGDAPTGGRPDTPHIRRPAAGVRSPTRP